MPHSINVANCAFHLTCHNQQISAQFLRILRLFAYMGYITPNNNNNNNNQKATLILTNLFDFVDM